MPVEARGEGVEAQLAKRDLLARLQPLFALYLRLLASRKLVERQPARGADTNLECETLRHAWSVLLEPVWARDKEKKMSVS